MPFPPPLPLLPPSPPHSYVFHSVAGTHKPFEWRMIFVRRHVRMLLFRIAHLLSSPPSLCLSSFLFPLPLSPFFHPPHRHRGALHAASNCDAKSRHEPLLFSPLFLPFLSSLHRTQMFSGRVLPLWPSRVICRTIKSGHRGYCLPISSAWAAGGNIWASVVLGCPAACRPPMAAYPEGKVLPLLPIPPLSLPSSLLPLCAILVYSELSSPLFSSFSPTSFPLFFPPLLLSSLPPSPPLPSLLLSPFFSFSHHPPCPLSFLLPPPLALRGGCHVVGLRSPFFFCPPFFFPPFIIRCIEVGFRARWRFVSPPPSPFVPLSPRRPPLSVACCIGHAISAVKITGLTGVRQFVKCGTLV